MAAAPTRVRRILRPGFALVIKLGLAVGLISWLVSTGRLEFTHVKAAYSDQGILFGAVLIWVVGVGGFATWRWQLLMRGLGLKTRFLRCCQLTLVGGFFNTVLVGTVGGDVVRAVYAYKDNKSRGRAAPATAVLMDRITGLYGLFILGVWGIVSNLTEIRSQPQLEGPVDFVIIIFLFLTVGFVAIQAPLGRRSSHFFTKLAKQRFVPRSVASIVQAFRSYRTARSYLFIGILLSVLIQGQAILFYWYVSQQVTGQEIPLKLQALVVPIGSLITAIPISPGGLGVGHAAFEQLYQLIGVSHGANIFNIIFLGQVAMNLLGVVPYLFLRSQDHGFDPLANEDAREQEDSSNVSSSPT